MNEIRKVLTGAEKRASEVYFAVLAIQSKVAVGAGILSALFGLLIRFAIHGGGYDGFVFVLSLSLISFIVFCVLGFWAVGHVMSLGDDAYKRRKRNGQYEAETNQRYAEVFGREVKDATPHRVKGGKLIGYMVDGHYYTVEEIANLIRTVGRVGGFYPSKNGFNEVQK